MKNGEAASVCEIYAQLNANDLVKLDFSITSGENSKVHVHDRGYLIERMRVNLPVKGLATLQV